MDEERQGRFDFPTAKDPIEAFEQFHADNPMVYAKLREFALQAKRSGRGHFGIRMLWERVRWYTNFETTEAPWKLNDHYHSFYARLLMAQEPELRGLFEVRKSRADAMVDRLGGGGA